MACQVWVVLLCTSVLLWQHGQCQYCSRDECEDVSKESVPLNHAQSMLQKSFRQMKLDQDPASYACTPLGGPCTLAAWNSVVRSGHCIPVNGFSYGDGVCAIVPATSKSGSVLVEFPPALLCTGIMTGCTVQLPDGFGTSGLCIPINGYGGGVCATNQSTGEVCPPGSTCSWLGYPGVCDGNQICDIWEESTTTTIQNTTTTGSPSTSTPTTTIQKQTTTEAVTTISSTTGAETTEAATTISSTAAAETTETTTTAKVQQINKSTTAAETTVTTTTVKVQQITKSTTAADTTEATTNAEVAELAGCPAACQSPACYKGAWWNSGLPLDVNGRCNYYCSKEFSGVRYCGQGSEYKTGDYVDCSGCAVDLYIHAPDRALSCPTGYEHLNNIEKCEEALTIHGLQYTWSGRSDCSWFWPRAGCFTWSGQMYYSTCDTGRAVSTWSHAGICKRQDASGITSVTTVAPPLGCPAACLSPTCRKGGKHNGGVALVNGKCIHHCSKEFSGARYCGVGRQYMVGDSVDCGGCATGDYVHAGDGSKTCPSGYKSLNDVEACKAGLVIDGVPYTWSGERACKHLWPRSGCFSHGNKLYFSLCEKTKPLTRHDHHGICKKFQR